jgi:hypothetical protein
VYDTIFDSLTASDWRRTHGKHWVIADVPYHLSYFDRDLVLSALKWPGPIEAPSVRHTGLGFYMSFFQLLARTDRLPRPFTFSLQFTGPGGGA